MNKLVKPEESSCADCPHFKEGWVTGGMIAVLWSGVPTGEASMCCHPDFEDETYYDHHGRAMGITSVPETIPAWCPLPDREPI